MKHIIVLAIAALSVAACKQSADETTQNDIGVEPREAVATTDSTIQSEPVTAVEPQEQEIVKAEPAKTITPAIVPSKKYTSFGSSITADHALDKAEMLKKYESMQKGDTLKVKFKSDVTSVCKKKGCWMKMDLAQNKESFVRFKDYGFFVPLNADHSEAVVSGRAFLDVISVDELRHYAKDGGKSQEEIDKITAPKITYAFEADGVLLAQ